MKNNSLIIAVATLLMMLSAFKAEGQSSITVSGTVKDTYGDPIPGVILYVGHKAIYMTDANGSFTTTTASDDDIVFSMVGYKEVTHKASSSMDVVLEFDAHKLAEIVNLGFTKQSRELLSDAVSTVSGKELEKSSHSRMSQILIGKLPGLSTIQTQFEPTRETGTQNYVRGLSTYHSGSMVVVIDGLPYENYSGDITARITPEEIESVSLIKDGISQAAYGIIGANGVLVINTKRGTTGKFKYNVGFSETIEKPSYINKQFDSYTYAVLRNQAAERDGLGKYKYYSQEALDAFKNGTDPILYPNNDWVKMMMRDVSHMQRLSFNASGGSRNVKYFTAMDVAHQGGFWITDSSQDRYSGNNNKVRVTFRSNVDVQINKWISMEMNLAGAVIKGHSPGSSIQQENIYSLLVRTAPTIYGPLTPTIIGEDGKTVSMDPDKVIASVNLTDSAFGQLNRSGYNNNTISNIYGNSALKFDLSFLTKGLWAGARIGYLSYLTETTSTTQSFERYYRDSDWTTLNFVRLGTTEDTPLSYSKSHQIYSFLSYKGEFGYTGDFGKHHFDSYGYATYQIHDDMTGNAGSIYDFRRVYSGVEVLYNYDKRYALKLATGYSATDYFPEKTRFIWTPGISAAWIASNERFIKGNIPWLTLLKFRGSLAITGNNSSGNARYDYKDQVTSSRGGIISYLEYTANESVYGNYSLAPEKLTKHNLGIDLGLANLVTISFDVFKERLDNGLVRSTAKVPEYQGVALSSYPIVNMGVYENKGWELAVGFDKHFNRNWSAFANGWISYNENKKIYNGEVARDETYVYPYHEQGYPVGQVWGYLVDYSNGNGLYNFQEEINAGPTYSFGTPRVGDIKYKDLNGDGKIDERDVAPIGHGSQPRYFFSLDLGAKYKNLELSLMFYGVGDYIRNYSSTYTQQTSGDGFYTDSHLGAWTPEKFANHEEISFPALSTKSTTNGSTSNYFYKDASFLRLKTVELSYTVPKRWSDAIGASSVRVYLDGENLLLFDKMETRDTPVEGSNTSFPYYKMFRMGINVSF